MRGWVRVDPADYDNLAIYRWSLASNGYAARGVSEDGKARTILMHRQILGLEPSDGRQTDHVNRDRLDNRRVNLRVATAHENGQNRIGKAGKTSRHRNVCWHAEKHKWRVTGQVNGRWKHVGYFDDEAEAGEVAAAFRAEHMPFACR